MPTDHIIVALQGPHWTTSHHGSVKGPFSNKEEALAVAVADAKSLNENGKPTEVIVENDLREFETVWTPDRAG